MMSKSWSRRRHNFFMFSYFSCTAERRGRKRKLPMRVKTAKKKKKVVPKTKVKKGTITAASKKPKEVRKSKRQKSILATAGKISEEDLERLTPKWTSSNQEEDDGLSNVPEEEEEDEELDFEVVAKKPGKKRKGVKNKNFFAEFSESPKKFIYMPEKLDNPEVQDLDLNSTEEAKIGADGTGPNVTLDATAQEEKSLVKVKEYSAEEIELDKIRENHLLNECVEAAKGSTIKCNLCAYQVDNKDSFREHLRRRHLDKRHVCEMCGAAFGMHNDLLKHKRRSHIHKHCCGICGKVYRYVRHILFQFL